MISRLLIVHHTPSPHCQEMFEAVVAGAADPEIVGVAVLRRPALTVSAVQILEADGYLLGTPFNLGYISGALKHYLGGNPLIAIRPARAASTKPRIVVGGRRYGRAIGEQQYG